VPGGWGEQERQGGPRVGLAECLLTALGADPDHQRNARDAAAHVAIDQERQAADHPLFHDVVPAGQQLPYPSGSLGIIAQGSSASFLLRLPACQAQAHSFPVRGPRTSRGHKGRRGSTHLCVESRYLIFRQLALTGS
jgi:hypothetical protein